MGSDGGYSCSGCGGSGQAQTMQPCPGCHGTGGQSYDPGPPVYAPPRGPLTAGQRIKVLLFQLIPLGGLAAYVYYTTR